MRSTDAEPGDAAYWSAAAATYDSAPDHGLADPGVFEAWRQRLAQWVSLLRPGGRFVFVEGEWSTGAGLTSDRTLVLLEPHCDRIEVEHLSDPDLWGHRSRTIATSPAAGSDECQLTPVTVNRIRAWSEYLVIHACFAASVGSSGQPRTSTSAPLGSWSKEI
jgi:hypothetical protein